MKSFLSKIKELFDFGNLLYYPGCMTHHVLKDIFENYKLIFKKANLDFITLDSISCCASPAKNMGYKDTHLLQIRRNIDLFKKHGVTKIVTNCPACYHIFKNNHKHDPAWNFKVYHTTEFILELLKQNKLKPKTQSPAPDTNCKLITYHDPCHLGRHSNIYSAPREILKKIGYEIKEMQNNKENSFCCGGGASLVNNNPELANSIAKKRIQMAPIKKITTCCPMCYKHLKNNAPFNIEILELSKVILDALQ